MEEYPKILKIPALVFIYRLRNKLRFICLSLRIRKLDKRYYIYNVLNCCPQLARASSFKRFLDHKQRRTTVSRTSLDE